MGTEQCCRTCCYSTPFTTLFALGVIVVGMVGYSGSAVYGVVAITMVDTLYRHVIVFAPVLCGAVLLGVIPLLLATIMGYCVTGYIKDELYKARVKRCIALPCSAFVMLVNFVYLLLWILVAVCLGAVLAVFVQLRLGCTYAQSIDPSSSGFINSTCLPAGDYGSSPIVDAVCGSDLDSLCDMGINAGLAFIATLGFALIVIIGQVMMLMVLAGNYVNGRENKEYREPQRRNRAATDGVDGDFDMKNIR